MISHQGVSTGLKRTLLGLAAAFVLFIFLAAAGLVVLGNSPAKLETVIEKVASRILNRELRIGEILEVEFSWDIYLVARDVRLSNPSWSDVPDFFSAKRVSVRISLPSIWRAGPILIHALKLEEPRLSLIAPAAQLPNWYFWPAGIDTDEGEPVVADDTTKRMFPVVISKGSVSEGEITYRDPDQDMVISIATLLVAEPRDGGSIELDLSGAVNDIPLDATVALELTAATLTQRNLELNLAIQLGELSIESRGTIDDLVHLDGADLHLEISAPRSRPLLNILGMPEVRDGPLSFEAHITDANPGIEVDVAGFLDEFNVRFTGTVMDVRALDGVDAVFEIGGPSLTEAGAMFDLEGLPDIPYKASGEFHRLGKVLGLRNGTVNVGQGHLSVEGRLPDFPEINDWELAVDGGGINLGQLGPLFGARGLPDTLYDISGKLESTDVGVELLSVDLASPELRLELKGVVGESPGYFDTRIAGKLSGENLATFGQWLRVSDLPAHAFQGSGELSLGMSGWQLRDGRFATQGLQMGLEGEFDKLPEPTKLKAKVKLASPNLAEALQLYGYEIEGLPPFPIAVDGKLSGSLHKLNIDEAAVVSGDSRLGISGLLENSLMSAGLDLAVAFSSPDLLKLLPHRKEFAAAQLPADVTGQLVRSPGNIATGNVLGHLGGASMNMDVLLNSTDSYDNSRVTITAKGSDLSEVLGPWLELKVVDVPFQLSLAAVFESGGVKLESISATVAQTQLKAQIYIDSLEDISSAHGDIEISGASSHSLARELGVQMSVPDAPYSLNVAVRTTSDSLRMDPIKLIWGKSDYGGAVDVDFGEVPVIQMDLHSKFVSLPFLLPDIEDLEEEVEEEVEGASVGEEISEFLYSQKLSTKELAERLIPNESLDLGWISDIEAKIKYQLDEMYLSSAAKTSATIDISIVDGVLSTQQMNWSGTFSSGDAKLSIRAGEEGSDIDLYFDVERIPLLWLLGGEPDNNPDSYYRGQMKTSGNSFRDWAKNSNGALVFKAGGGSLSSRGLDLVVGDVFEEVFTRINPYRVTEESTRIVCHAGAITIVDGKILAAPGLVVRADKMDVVFGGEINLHHEKVSMEFNTRSRKGLGVSASKAVTPYLKVGGTLANPRLSLDVKGAVLSGGAAVATAGLSIVAEGLWDRWVATSGDPCSRLIKRLSKDGNEVYKSLLLPRS